MRLTPPTRATFSTATLLLIVAVADRYAFDVLGDEVSFAFAALGGAILWIGSVFNRV